MTYLSELFLETLRVLRKLLVKIVEKLKPNLLTQQATINLAIGLSCKTPLILKLV